jgi:hypothetical protein
MRQRLNDDELRQLYHAGLPGRSAAGSCPDDERLVALVERTDHESERLATLDHVMACAECRRQFDLLRALYQAHTQLQADTEQPRAQPLTHRARFGIPRRLALAASISIVIGAAALFVIVSSDRETPVMRGASADLQLTAPAADAAVALPFTLSWRAVDGAAEYHVEITNSMGRTALATHTRDTAFTVAAAALPAPGSYAWSVRAVRTDGSEVHSAARAFRVPR